MAPGWRKLSNDASGVGTDRRIPHAILTRFLKRHEQMPLKLAKKMTAAFAPQKHVAERELAHLRGKTAEICLKERAVFQPNGDSGWKEDSCCLRGAAGRDLPIMHTGAGE